MKIKLLFQGDSITDCFRTREDTNYIGLGYPKYAVALLKEKYPEVEFEFVNRGVGGNQTMHLINRLQEDLVDINPDIVSILIGINDVWHHTEGKNWLPDDVFEERYRTILDTIKEKTHAKLMMMEPFLIPVPDKLFFREDLAPKIEIIRKLAREYADVYLPTDGLLASAFIGDEPTSFSNDGVHPNDKGSEFIGKLYVDYISKIIDNMIK